MRRDDGFRQYSFRHYLLADMRYNAAIHRQ
jgi:hypothetical protein